MEKSSSLKNKIVFFGTPFFAASILKYLIEHKVPVAGVVTQPDRPKGRTAALTPPPVKQVVQQLGGDIPCLQPEKASEASFLNQLSQLQADFYVVVAYGQILSQKLLSIPPLGCINVHASLLPKYRGAAPIQRCLEAGEKQTGIAIQKMVKQLDAGDVIRTAKVEIPDDMTFGELEAKLCEVSKPLLLEVIKLFDLGIPEATPQDPSMATYASKIAPAEGEILWGQSAEQIHNTIRAFSPRPGAWCWLEPNVKKMKILRSEKVEGKPQVPGKMLSLKEGIVACGKNAIRLIEVQPEGKKVMAWSDWIRGAPSFHGFVYTDS